MPPPTLNGSRPRGGFVVITAALSMAGLLAVVGLAVDVGHIYVVRSELQIYADESAMAAAFELDGTAQGLARAANVALVGPVAGSARNRWDFGTQTVSAVSVQFAASAEGPFDANPVSAASQRFVRVEANAGVALYFLPFVPGIVGPKTVGARAVAGQEPRDSLGNGLAPFAPAAHLPEDPEFGFTRGQLYTMRWAPVGQREKEGGSCPGDAGFDPGSASDRGYMDVGQGSGASALRAAVVNSGYFLPLPLSIGSPVTMFSGQESVPDAVEQRFQQDSDLSALSYDTYAGNGRRLLVVAVTDRSDPPRVVGFGAFFLQPTPCGTKNTTPCCAEYVGSAVVSGKRRGVGPTGLYSVRLAQ
jgi:hypothetical protein